MPFMPPNFGVAAVLTNWGIAIWSMGGTCAVDLTVMHPDIFSATAVTSVGDIVDDLRPNKGTKDQAIIGLFGSNFAA